NQVGRDDHDVVARGVEHTAQAAIDVRRAAVLAGIDLVRVVDYHRRVAPEPGAFAFRARPAWQLLRQRLRVVAFAERASVPRKGRALAGEVAVVGLFAAVGAYRERRVAVPVAVERGRDLADHRPDREYVEVAEEHVVADIVVGVTDVAAADDRLHAVDGERLVVHAPVE